MSAEAKAYLVLHPEETRAAFETAAAALGFTHHETRPGDGRTRAYEQVWATPDRSAAVNYLEDPSVQPRYLSIRTVHANALDQLVAEFARKLAVEDGEDAIELAAGAIELDTCVYSLHRVAIVFPEYEPRAFRVFEAYATEHPHPMAHETAVFCTLVRAWPECRPLLERVARDDPDESVRAYAAEALAQWPEADGR